MLQRRRWPPRLQAGPSTEIPSWKKRQHALQRLFKCVARVYKIDAFERRKTTNHVHADEHGSLRGEKQLSTAMSTHVGTPHHSKPAPILYHYVTREVRSIIEVARPRFPGREDGKDHFVIHPSAGHQLPRLVDSQLRVWLGPRANALLDRLNGDFLARIEEGRPLLEGQVPGIARLFGG